MSNRKAQYLEFCAATKVPLPLQPWWLDAVCSAEHWSVALATDKGGTVTGALPYFLTRRLGFTVIQLPPLTSYAGPWLHYPENAAFKETSKTGFEHRALAQLIGDLPHVAFFRQNFRPELQNWLPFYWAGYRQTTRYTYMLPWLEDINERYARLKNTLRTELKTAWQVTTIVPENDPDLLFRLNRLSFGRKGVQQPYRITPFLRLHNALAERGFARIFIARDRQTGIPHAGLYLVFDEQRAAVLLAGFDPALGIRSHALHGLYWEAIRFCTERGLSLDFEGSMQPGIERVFRAFGAQITPYFQVWKTRNRLFDLALSLVR